MDTTAECCICLDKIKLSITLQCQHKFCYLCLKAAFDVNEKCPLCRRDISQEIIDNATLETKVDTDQIRWMYSGRNNGWWYYEPSISDTIEKGYQKFLDDESNLEVDIMGRVYIIDYDEMVQTYKNYSRKIQRKTDQESVVVKGIAGMKL